MIDTIGIKIYCDAPSMKNFVNKIESLKTDFVLSDKPINDNLNYNTRLVYMKRNSTKYGESEKEFLKGKIHGSNVYGISWFYDKKSKILKFDFSLPKYLYGNNIKMWLPHTRIFNFEDVDMTILSKELKKYITEVCLKFSVSNRLTELEANHIHIVRLDFCFNYVFKNEQQRNICYYQLKEHKKKYSRDSEDTFYNFKNETIMYKASGYSLKYYKKDIEFKKYGKKLVIGKYGIDYAERLHEVATRTLRFELTLFNEKISYLLRKYIDLNYFGVKNELSTNYKSVNVKLFSYATVPTYREDFLINKEFKFNSYFLNIMLAYFYDELEQWKLNQYISDDTFNTKIEKAKSQNPKMRVNKLRWYWLALKNDSLDQLASKGTIHRNTIPNVRKAFESIGIDLKSISKEEFSGMPSFSDYIRNTYRI